MDIILTSFGFLNRRNRKDGSIFYRMPPISISKFLNKFVLDCSVLFLCDKLILDKKTFEMFESGDYPKIFREVADVTEALYSEGYISLIDFDDIINKNKNYLRRLKRKDLEEPEIWLDSLYKSFALWHEFRMKASIFHATNEYGFSYDELYVHSMKAAKDEVLRRKVMEIIENPDLRENPKNQQLMVRFLSSYLNSINANIVLSKSLNAGFHDWGDFSPLYQEKFQRLEKPLVHQEGISHVNKLFDVAFPEFIFEDRKALIKALKDKRVFDLRKIVESAVQGDVVFDREFANKTLISVLQTEHKISRLRNIVSYLTLPIGLIPVVGSVLPKVVEEVAGKMIEGKLKEDFRWFYLISDYKREDKGFL